MTPACFPLQFNLCHPAANAFGLTITFIWILSLTIYGYNKVRKTNMINKYIRFV